jgi:glycosyltransferase involved in cell wall biosynthesis
MDDWISTQAGNLLTGLLGLAQRRMTLEGKLLPSLRQRLRQYRLYMLASGLKYSLEEMRKFSFISLKPERRPQGDVLLSYADEPFYLKPGQPASNSHTYHWESLQIATTFLDLGYGVDVINWTNDRFIPRKDYSFFIDCRKNLERIAPLLNKDCVKIMHIDAAHWIFHMAAQYRRLLALKQRKGVSLPLRKIVEPNWAIEHADCATILGNEFTLSTYSYANKPLYRVPISTPVLYPWPEWKDFEACRKRFLWFGSSGLVHKGLDLVLEAFVEMPEYQLTVCGPIDGEVAFQRVYYKELYQTPNIETIGWVDISSSKFREITNKCIGVIYPSCSEGQSGSVVTCLHAGLIPIVSYESGVDIHDVGFLLKNCSINEIQDSIQMVANLPSRELKLMSRKAWEFARANHTREKFAEEYRKIVTTIITTHGNKGGSFENKRVGSSFRKHFAHFTR